MEISLPTWTDLYKRGMSVLEEAGDACMAESGGLIGCLAIPGQPIVLHLENQERELTKARGLLRNARENEEKRPAEVELRIARRMSVACRIAVYDRLLHPAGMEWDEILGDCRQFIKLDSELRQDIIPALKLELNIPADEVEVL